MKSIDEVIAVAADTEASGRIVAMMNDQPFHEGKPDRFHMVAKMICSVWVEEASDRFRSIEEIEQTIIDKENEMFSSAFKR